jgi:DNA-binding response OmpR family regulator
VSIVSEDKGLIVVVEDETAIVDLERLYLQRAGFTVHVESNGAAGLEQIRRLHPVAVILDVGVPGLDGIEVCRRLRGENNWTPVIFVTARDDEIDRILGLELGADDYVTKPFSPRELIARVKALVRRSEGPATQAARQVGDVSIDLDRHVVTVSGGRIDVTATEFDLLAQLMAQPERVFTREQLLSLVWGVADYSSSRTVDVHIAQLRAKLGPTSPIRTVRGVGYCISEFAA